MVQNNKQSDSNGTTKVSFILIDLSFLIGTMYTQKISVGSDNFTNSELITVLTLHLHFNCG